MGSPVRKCRSKTCEYNPFVLEEDCGFRLLVDHFFEAPPDPPLAIGLTCIEAPQDLPILDQHSLEGDISAFSKDNLDGWDLLTGRRAEIGEGTKNRFPCMSPWYFLMSIKDTH